MATRRILRFGSEDVAAEDSGAVQPRPEESARLRKVAADIDEVLGHEMMEALRDDAPTDPPRFDPADGEPSAFGAKHEEGDLSDTDLPLLIGQAFRIGLTGKLTLRCSDIEKIVYFEAGRPVLAISNRPEDRMIELLVRQGRIGAESYQHALNAAEHTGRKMGALLIELGVLKTTELLSTVRQHFEEIVFSLFSWTSGRWRMERGIVASPKQARLLRHPSVLVREGLRRGYPPERIAAGLGSPRNVFVVSDRLGVFSAIEEFASRPDERRLALSFDGVRSLEDVVRINDVEERAAIEIIFAMWCFGLLRPANPPISTGGPHDLARDREIDRERILGRHAMAVEGDYFQVLGMSRDATANEIRAAHQRIRAAFAPETLGAELERTAARELATIRQVLDEAVRVLGSATLRARYQARLGRGL